MAHFGIFVVATLVMIAIIAVSPSSIVFEDSKSQLRSDNYDTDSRALILNETPAGQQLAHEDTRHHHNHIRRMNKRVICGLAHLIAKREADANLQRKRRETPEQGRGLGVVGFLLGAFVGSKYQQHQYQYQTQPHPPPHQQQQQQQGQGQPQISNEDYDQVEDQGGGGHGNNGGGGGQGGSGGLCNSLQQQNNQQYFGGIGSGSHPILASLLTSGGGGGAGPNKIGQLPQTQSSAQLSQFQRPGQIQFSQFQRPAPVNEPQFQRPAPVQIRPHPLPQRPIVQQQQQQGGFVNTYVRPWVDLFL